MKNHRYHELDSLRAIAALGVVCWHYVNSFHSAPFGHVLAPFFRHGLLMVDFFFILSGFVLARAFWTDGRSKLLGPSLWSRVARLYPLHVTTLFLVALIQWYFIAGLKAEPFIYPKNDTYHFALNLLLLQNSGLQHGASFNAPSWSISTEFLVNVAFLSLILLPRRLAALGMTLLCVTAIAGLASHGMLQGGEIFGLIDGGIVRTFAGFFLGVGLYSLHSQLKFPLQMWIYDVAALVTTLSIGIYLGKPALWTNAGDMISSFIGFPLIILTTIRSGVVRWLLTRPFPIYLGEISYSLYLMHFPLILIVHLWSAATSRTVPYESRVFFVAFLTATVLLAGVTYRFVEQPGRRWLSSLYGSSLMAAKE